ncbi:MAG TPA: tetratricopeptide repeat protein [Candidatus Saccharimonadales bacterium]|nr:tetratricopeptide repeat protein [Candidatus Saccharimonadales bacterium]
MIGQTLGHYSIVEKIGAGGMGIVYRAHDEQLDRDVALKVLPIGTLDEEAARKQFRKEALALARLSHPNIATVFEFSSQDGIDFLAMELIPGTPLNVKLNSGPLLEREALRIAAQLAEGLAAAHEQGVIHRDLKPANLFLTPDGRLKILDFGLAKFVHPDPANAVTMTVTADTGSVSGTLPYMSPEQLRGMPVDARSDIYAAGAVLYEMATAQRPFPQTQGAVLTGAILHETPPLPQTVNPRVSVATSNVIMKVLEKEPTRRYQSARELGVALEGLHSGAHTSGPEIASKRKTGVAIAAALGIVLLGGLAIGSNLGGVRDRLARPTRPAANEASPRNSPFGPVRLRRSVAVMGFKNLSGHAEAAWVATALSEMMTTELGAGEELRTVPGEQVARMKLSLALPEADSFAKETLGRIRQNIGSDAVILGSYLASGNGQVRLDMRVQDAITGEILVSVTETGPEGEIGDTVARAGAKLRQTLGADSVSAVDMAAMKSSMPSNASAMRFYSEGVAKLRNFDSLAARNLLQKAITADPKCALSHNALSQVWRNLGREKEAKDAIKKARDLSSGLPLNDRLLVAANYHLVNHEWQKAREVFERLYRTAPDNLEYGLAYVSAQTKSGDLQGAYVTVDSLRKLPSPVGESPRIDMVEADAAATEGDTNRVLATYAAAAEKARASGARLILASSLNRQSFALGSSGQIAKAMAATVEARAIYEAVGDASGVAASKYTMATMLFQRGDLQEAASLLNEIVRYGERTADQTYLLNSLTVLAQIQVRQGNLPAARKNYEQVLAGTRAQDDRYGEQFALNGMADTLFDMGDRVEAKKYYEQSIALSKITGDKASAAGAQFGLADVLQTRGDTEGAMKLLEQAMATYEELGQKVQAAQTLNVIAGIRSGLGESETAEKDWRKVRQICQEAQIKSCAAKATLNIGDSLSDKGKKSEAVAQYEQAVAMYQEMGEKGNLSNTFASIAQSKIDLGDLGSANKYGGDALAMARASGNKDSWANALHLQGKILVSQGKLTEAQKNFEQSLAAYQSLNLKEQIARSHRALGKIRAYRDDLGGAQSKIEEAISIFKEIRATSTMQSTQLELANIELSRSRADRAIEIAQAALDDFVKAKLEQGTAHLLLASALADQGKAADAQKELQAAISGISAEENLSAKIALAITAAQVKAAAGRPEEGIPALEIALSDATSHGYVPERYEVQLALGIAEMKAGRIAAARTRLTALQKEASARGFLLVARKAKEVTAKNTS